MPSGLWEPAEYAKLPAYDDPQTSYAPFHCHQENVTGDPTICRGWLTVAAESAAARLCVLEGSVTDEERYAEPHVPLWPSGAAAAEHGMRDVADPGAEARAMVAKLEPRLQRRL